MNWIHPAQESVKWQVLAKQYFQQKLENSQVAEKVAAYQESLYSMQHSLIKSHFKLFLHLEAS
jgi:hypothetical protein